MRSFVETSFKIVGIELHWMGVGVDEVGYAKNRTNPFAPRRPLVTIDRQFYRPTETEKLLGDPSKASEKLGWAAATPVEQLCKEMVQADLIRFGEVGSGERV